MLLPAPGGPMSKHMVGAGRRHFQRPLHVLLAHHIGKIRPLGRGARHIDRAGPEASSPSPRKNSTSCSHMADTGITWTPVGHRRLGLRLPAGTDRAGAPLLGLGRQRHGQHACRRAAMRHPGSARPEKPIGGLGGRDLSRSRTKCPARWAGRTQAPLFSDRPGARFTVMRRSGKSKPQLRAAARTRSLDSFTEASGSPTISKAGSPLDRSHSHNTGTPSMPRSPAANTFATIPSTPFLPRWGAVFLCSHDTIKQQSWQFETALRRSFPRGIMKTKHPHHARRPLRGVPANGGDRP